MSEKRAKQCREWFGPLPLTCIKFTLGILTRAYENYEHENEAEAFLERWAKRLPDRIAEDILDTDPIAIEDANWMYGEPWVHSDEIDFEEYKEEEEYMLIATVIHRMFQELTHKEPKVVLRALHDILDDGGELRGLLIPVYNTFLKLGRRRLGQ